MRPIVLTLMLVLLLTGSGEAEEKIKISDIPTSGCTAGHTWNGKEFPPPTCEQRMKEAMRAIDYYLNLSILPRIREGQTFRDKIEFASPYEMKAWDQIMRDCVKETP